MSLFSSKAAQHRSAFPTSAIAWQGRNAGVKAMLIKPI